MSQSIVQTIALRKTSNLETLESGIISPCL